MAPIRKSSSIHAATTLCSAFLLGNIAGCDRWKSPDELVNDAKTYQSSGNTSAALIQLKNALQKKPDAAEARYTLATVYEQTGDVQSAEKELRRALEYGSDRERAVPLLGKILLRQGRFQDVLDEIVPLPQASPAMLALRGKAYLQAGKHDDARHTFEQALQVAPTHPDALVGLGMHAMTQRDMASATRWVDQAVHANPTHADARHAKAELLRLQGMREAALTAYDETIRLNRYDSTAHLMKASLQTDARQFAAAQAEINAAKKITPHALPVYYAQALLDFAAGNPKAARESLQQILRAVPEHMPSLLLAGAVEGTLGAHQQAEQYLKRFLDHNPNNLQARKLLATTLLKNGQGQHAMTLISEALRDTPQDTQWLALAGQYQLQEKNFVKATDYFTQATTLDPTAATLRTALGVTKLNQGQVADAALDFGAAAELTPQAIPGPNAANPTLMLALSQLRLKEYDQALATAKKLERQMPDNPDVHNLTGVIHMARHDLPRARSSLEKALALRPTFYPAVANLARLDMQEKTPEAAKKRLEAFLVKENKHVPAMIALATLALSQGKTQEATAWLERAASENPSDVRASLQLALHYLRTGDKQKALTHAEKLHAAHRDNPEVLAVLGQVQLATDKKEAALESFQRLAALRPNTPAIQLQIANVYLALQNRSAAEQALKKAIAIKPDFLDAQVALAKLEGQAGQYERALVMARNIQQQHKSAVGHILEGDLLIVQNKPALAVKAYEQGLTLQKNTVTLIKVVDALRRVGRTEEAQQRTDQWLQDNPNDHQLRLYIGTQYVATKQNKAAIAQFEELLKRDTNNIAALNNIAYAYHQEKDPRAVEFGTRAHQLAPDNPAVLDTLGWIYIEQGDTVRGLPLLQKAVSLAPHAMEVRYHLALGLVKAGDKSGARRELEHLLATDKPFSNKEDAKTLLKQL